MKFLFCLFILFIGLSTPLLADTPFQGFRYNHWGQLTPSPAAYIPVMSVGASDICDTLGEFSNPQHMNIDNNGNIYISDTGNNRIVVFDKNLNLIRVIDEFLNNGIVDIFNNPNGIFVNDDFSLHIADTGNNRIVSLDEHNNLIRILENPEGDVLPEDFNFIPLHVIIGRDDVMYVIARNVTEGIMIFNRNAEFIGFYGTIRVLYNPLDLLWRRLQTAEQRARQRLFIPTEFLSMVIDEYGFVFTTNAEHMGSSRNLVMRLNPRGQDVLRNYNANLRVAGTLDWEPWGLYSGPSVFVDIVAREYGMYSALDITRNRVYTYDSEGNLLYVFSGIGNIAGMTHRPVAIEILDDNILILDAHRGQILYFEPTFYGELINQAIALQYKNDEIAALEYWRTLIEIDEHFALAFAGIGRAYFADGDYRLAMDYLRRGMDLRYYSLAFIRHRTETLHDGLQYILTAGLIFAVFIILRSIYKRVKKHD